MRETPALGAGVIKTEEFSEGSLGRVLAQRQAVAQRVVGGRCTFDSYLPQYRYAPGVPRIKVFPDIFWKYFRIANYACNLRLSI